MPKLLSDADVKAFRSRIRDVAAAQFARHGYVGVTMRELSRVMKVSPMTPYRYFKDRDEIVASLRAAAFGRFAEALEIAFDAGEDPMTRSRSVGRAYLEFALGEPDAYRLIFDLTQPEESRYPELAAQSARARRLLARQVDELIAARLVRGSRKVVQYALWGCVHGVILLHLSGKYSKKECVAAYNETMRYLFTGFAVSASTRRRSPSVTRGGSGKHSSNKPHRRMP